MAVGLDGFVQFVELYVGVAQEHVSSGVDVEVVRREFLQVSGSVLVVAQFVVADACVEGSQFAGLVVAVLVCDLGETDAVVLVTVEGLFPLVLAEIYDGLGGLVLCSSSLGFPYVVVHGDNATNDQYDDGHSPGEGIPTLPHKGAIR